MTAESKSAMAEKLLTFLDNVTAAALQENLDMLKRFVREATNGILREAFAGDEKPASCYRVLPDTKDKALDTRIESAKEALIGDQAKYEVMQTSAVVARSINRLAMAVQAAIADGKYDKDACLSVVIAARALRRVTALYSGWSNNCCSFRLIELAEQGEDCALTIHSHFFSVRNTTYIRLYGYGDGEIKKIMYSQPHKNVLLIGRWANTHNPGVQFIYLLGTSRNDHCIVKEDGKFELYRMKEEFAEKYQFGYPPPEAIAEVFAAQK